MVAAMGRAAAADEEEDVEFVDYEQDDEDAMEEDGRAARALPVPHIVSPAVVRTRGRFAGRSPSVLASSRDRFDSLNEDGDDGRGPQRSIEGWTILVCGVKEDAEEEDLHNAFSEFGRVKDLHLNLERRTGYAKGYALIEYESFEEALAAIRAMNGSQLLTDYLCRLGIQQRSNEEYHEYKAITPKIQDSTAQACCLDAILMGSGG